MKIDLFALAESILVPGTKTTAADRREIAQGYLTLFYENRRLKRILCNHNKRLLSLSSDLQDELTALDGE